MAQKVKGRYESADTPSARVQHRFMIRPFRLTPRQMLIVVHDLVATAAAILASFYVRFEEKGLVERWDGLLSFLPLFVLYAGIVYHFFHLYEREVALRLAARSLEYLPRRDRARDVAAGARLHPGGARTSTAPSSSARSRSSLYWLLQMFFLGGPRIAYRYFRYSRTRQHAKRERFRSDPRPRPRRRCRSAAARDRKRRGQEDLAGRHPVAVAGRSGPVDPRHPCARHFRRSRSARSSDLANRGTQRASAGADAVRLRA